MRTVPISIDSSTQSDEAQQARGDLRYLLQTIPPFLAQWGSLPDSFEALYQQALHDLAEASFGSRLSLVTVWAAAPAPPTPESDP